MWKSDHADCKKVRRCIAEYKFHLGQVNRHRRNLAEGLTKWQQEVRLADNEALNKYGEDEWAQKWEEEKQEIASLPQYIDKMSFPVIEDF